MDKIGDILGSLTNLVSKVAVPLVIIVLVVMAIGMIRKKFFNK